ncbi:conserved hypothetical protein [Desulforamulus reducens MI-1]|uniref:DUF1904 domain-containing protein n=1 Tax=Desulforamulus reducens (strain ATCC BAA-1160 / DSM 100696 / MI-1) TaxID=349161 RepID=A4J4K9_DESRM|nr:DUF1904 domain-containing protein [Desulforamulus reducens]ABO50012.1 conserved hypothetical protein [Desulforamulus reducens MI-1]
MPQIIIRGIEPKKIMPISNDLISNLEKIIGCPREDLTLECIPSIFVKDGSIDAGYPFVEIGWFDRGQSVQDLVAKEITNQIQRAGFESVDIMFTTFTKNKYYENGQHFG